MKRLLFSFVLFTIFYLLFTIRVNADITCQPTYGGGQTCVSTGNILVDKKVLNPETQKMTDNLGVNDGKFIPGSTINFLINLVNTGHADIKHIDVKDVFPQYVLFTKGPGKFDANTKTLAFKVTNLLPKETRVFTIEGKVVDQSRLPTNLSIICVLNQATVTTSDSSISQDSTQFCIQKSPLVLPASTTKGGFPVLPPSGITTSPATGQSSIVLFSLVATGIAGFFLRKNAAKNKLLILKWLKHKLQIAMKLIIKRPIITLTLVGIFLCLQNYTPGTILSGWDTLHPEFNFEENIKREIFGVFRNHQGLGAVAAHSDMADLPHILILYLFHFFIDLDLLRYFYIFSNLILGAVGMYLFLYKIVLKDKISAFLGGLFYLLNLGTMQQFVVPFEMFTTQYATLPWLFLLATSYLSWKKNSKKLLLFFSIVTIFSSPTAFAPTLWYIYLFVFTSYIFLLAIPKLLKKNLIFAKRAFILMFLTVILNLYWILPNIYYIFSHGSDVSGANISKIFSPQAFLYNKEFGNILDISFLKSFLFDWSIYIGNNNFGQLLSPWIKHLNSPVILGIGFIFAFIALIGMIKGFFGKNKFLFSFVPAILLCLLFLFNDNFPFGGLYNFLNNHVPFFKEAYRFPANKVLGIFTFIYAISFAAGFMITKKYIKRFSLIYSFIFVILIIFYMSPSFGGNFISHYMRVKIPQMYFEMFDWFKTKPQEARIANFPIHSVFGWEYYSWYADKPSFQGAGFTWFGIKQPLLNRDFDRWSTYNEKYYKDMSYAIYSQNPSLLKATLEKYNIKYILLDKSIISPQNDPKMLSYKETQDLLENEPYIRKVQDFASTLIIYEVGLKNNLSQYSNNYPFLDITDNQSKILPNLLSFNDSELTINLPLKLSFPSFLGKETVFPGGSIAVYPKKPQKEIIPNIFSLNYSLKPCDKSDTKYPFGINKEKKTNSFSLFGLNNQVCMTIPLKSILKNEKIGSEPILRLSLDYKAQAPVGFCLSSLTDNTCIDYGAPGSTHVLKYFSLKSDKLENLGITFYLDATNSKFEEKVAYENISVGLTVPISTKSQFNQDSFLKINNKSITLPLPKSGQLNHNKIKISKTNQNCNDSSFINPFLENQTSENTENHFIKYISQEGVSCDRFSYDLSQNQAYLVLVTSRNTNGLPLTFCVENKISKHCDIYTNLSTSSDFVTQAFLLPPQIKNAKGYDIIVKSLGIKKTDSINDLKSIQIIPFPYNFLSQIKYSSNPEEPKADLIMPQSYEKGWKAYQVQSSKFKVQSWISRTFPFFFREELKDHVLVNGWENGWILDSSAMKQPARQSYAQAIAGGFNNETIVILFLPQYLEYLGFALLLATLIYLAVFYRKF